MISQKEVSQIVQKRLDNLYKSAETIEIKEAQQEIVNFYSNLRDFPGWKERMDAAEFERNRKYFLAQLVEIKNASLTSDKGKIKKDLESNGLFLSDLIQLYNQHNKSEKEIVEEVREGFLNGEGHKMRNWTLNSQENSAFQDPAIDNLGSMRELEEIINELREIDNEIKNGRNPFFRLKKLKEWQGASPDTNLGKAVQALNKNGDLLNSAINSLIKKSKESKEKILNSLSDWQYEWNIIRNIKNKNSLICKNGEVDSWVYPVIFLSEEDFQAVKQAIIDNIIKTIKESPSEWKIVEICTFDADMHGYYTLGATKGYQEWDTMLINKSTPLEYDGEGFLVRKPQKMYDESLFAKEEFQQIKNILGVSAIKKIPFQKNGYKLNDEAKTKKNKENSSKAGIIIAIIFLAGVVVGAFFVFFKKKN